VVPVDRCQGVGGAFRGALKTAVSRTKHAQVRWAAAVCANTRKRLVRETYEREVPLMQWLSKAAVFEKESVRERESGRITQ
jgi:hypothetical protein